MTGNGNANGIVPNWLNANLFLKVLQDNVPGFKEIVDFHAKGALAPGENYATVMLKVFIDCRLKDGSLSQETFMLKVPHNNELYHKEMVKFHMFATEAGMYRHIVPAFEKLYRDKGLEVRFGAKSYDLPLKEEYVLLEDLSRRGFRNVRRQDCLDMHHCKGVLKKQAQFHAASVMWMLQNGPFPQMYSEGMVMRGGEGLMGGMLNSGFAHTLNAIQSLASTKPYYQEMKEFGNHLLEAVYEQNVVDESDFNVLNHGDCWANNIMFQYDKQGKMVETYFVDLQLPRYGSPAQDLIYFIFSSAQYELKIARFDEMIKYYHEQLIEHLKILEYPKRMPLLKEIHQMIIKGAIWSILTIIITMAAVLCDPTDSASVDNFVGDSEENQEFKKVLYTNKRFLKHLEITIPWLCNRGAFK